MAICTSQSLKWNELFPTKWSLVIFVLYMALFINHGILVRASQLGQGSYNYDPVTAVLLTEIIKLFVSVGMFVHRQSVTTFVDEVRNNANVFLLYFIPASFYCFYNNLSYSNLITFDPTTYFLLLQFRVVVTGIAFQVVFNKKLSKYQWISLILLTIGCMIKEIKFDFGLEFLVDEKREILSGQKESREASKGNNSASTDHTMGIFLIFLQVVFSSCAGVYNEFLLKFKGAHVPVLVQNTCLYVDSIICNILLLIILPLGDLGKGLSFASLQQIFETPLYLAVVVNSAAIGIVTSFFLAQLNSILKTFASALELMFTAILCWLIFGIPIYGRTFIAIFVVTLAIYLYSLQPVVNRGKIVDESLPTFVRPRKQEEMQKILDEECL